MPSPNPGFVQSLHNLDSLLSCRWGDLVCAFVIERVASIPDIEMKYLLRREARLNRIVHDESHPQHKKQLETWKSTAEEVKSARAGKRIVMIATVLSDQIYNELCRMDSHRYGGYSRFADELEAAEAKMYAEQERIEANSRHAYNLEVADMIHFVWRKKEDMLLNGERNLSKLLHGKRSNKPLITPEKKADPKIVLATH